jgi:hypothetical protein
MSDQAASDAGLDRVVALLSGAPVQLRELDFTPPVPCELCAEGGARDPGSARWRVRGQDSSQSGAALEMRVCSEHADEIDVRHRGRGTVTRVNKPRPAGTASTNAWDVVRGLFNL